MRVAQRQDPLSPIYSQWIARFFLYQKRPADAVEESLRTLELDPEYARGHMTLGLARLMLGETYAGLACLRRSAEVSGSASFDAFLAYGLAAAYGMLGDRDEAFLQLDRALDAPSAGLIYLHLDPLYDSIRDDPRFGALVAEIGLE
jgi:adenylate cyclase